MICADARVRVPATCPSYILESPTTTSFWGTKSMKGARHRNCPSKHKKCGNLKTAALAAAIFCFVQPLAHAQTVADSARVQNFDIPAQPLATALREFAKQSGQELLFSPEVAAQKTTGGIKATLPPLEALNALLQNTDVSFSMTNNGAILLNDRVAQGETSASAPIDSDPPNSKGRIGKLGAGSAQDSEDTTQNNQEGPSGTSPEAVNLDAVVVTGTRIRGSNPTSPVHTITRSDIENSGYSQIGDLIRSLPENFSGGQNPGVVAAGGANGANQNISNASTINLRGLGSDATLVLLNGNRLSADTYYQGSDISGVPFAAVQRIEVVPDGASALYGSDAVAGVVNIIPRRDYSGGELSARVGNTTEGGGREQTLSFLQGVSGERGYWLTNLEWSKQDPIGAGQRDRTSAVPADGNLIQGQDRRSLYIGAGWEFSDRTSLTFDGLASDRSASGVNHFSALSPLAKISVHTPAYSAALTLDQKLVGDWDLRISTVKAASHNTQRYSYPDYGITGSVRYANDQQYAEVTADGTLFNTSAGDVKLALGGGYREESFRESDESNSRHVSYFYLEALAPLVTHSSTRTGLHDLELSLSARTESYSDFGGTTNSRIGLRYLPLNDLSIRAAWGTSFKAPSFLQMNGPFDVYLYPSSIYGSTAGGTGLMTWGGNPNLKPETATSRTFGAEYTPSSLPSLQLSATWFDIDYNQRVVQPIASHTSGLSNPVYAPFVDLAPSASDQAALIASADAFYNETAGAYDPTSVIAILNNRYANATAQTVNGVDLGLRQVFDLAGGEASLFGNATWTRLKQQTLPSDPERELSGTIFNVPNFKARGGLTWTRERVSMTGIINYVGSETDTGVNPHQPVASWTTIDANISYQFSGDADSAKGWRAALSSINLFNKVPPYTASPLSYAGLHFDSTNHSIIGRFLSLTVTRAW